MTEEGTPYPPSFRVPRPPTPMIVKSNGQIEAFNRAKMIASMRNAGATPQQANIAASRIVTRFPQGGQIQSQQISQMVTQSLSEVNPAASRNYVATNEQKMAYNQRVNRLSFEISSINQQLDSLTSRIENLDNQIRNIPNRILKIRQARYRFLTYLETDQAALAQEWNNISPEVRTTVNLKTQNARSQVQTLQQRLSQKTGIGNYDQGNLMEIETGLNPLRSSLSEIYTSINSAISPAELKYDTINQDLTQVESTLSILQGASFPWEENETPILSIKAKELNSDHEGYLSLTNLKFVFEHENEIILKKTLFIVTEKKVVREVKVQKPIGMITDLTQGKVGFFKGTGLFVRFAPESGLPEMKFDTSGQDAECVVKQYNYIMSGEAEQHLESTNPITTKIEDEQKTPQLISCRKCGAPYTEKIYRGQTSLNCKYCGAVIAID